MPLSLVICRTLALPIIVLGAATAPYVFVLLEPIVATSKVKLAPPPDPSLLSGIVIVSLTANPLPPSIISTVAAPAALIVIKNVAFIPLVCVVYAPD